MHDVECEFSCAVAMRSSNGRERPQNQRFSASEAPDQVGGEPITLKTLM